MAESTSPSTRGTTRSTCRCWRCGAVGVISVTGHLVADRHAALIDALAAGDLTAARAINDADAAGHRRCHDPHPGSHHEQGRAGLLGFPVGSVRFPLVDATHEEVDLLRADLAAGGVL